MSLARASDTPQIARARFPEDSGALAALMLSYVAFLCERMPEERDNILRKYDPDRIEEMVAGFAQAHARPKGELLIARGGNEPVGCGMMREMEPGIVEIHRVFVMPTARGLGLGKAILQALMERARLDGQRIVRLDTGRSLSEAVAMYRAMGFRERPSYHAATPYLDHALLFFEREL